MIDQRPGSASLHHFAWQFVPLLLLLLHLLLPPAWSRPTAVATSWQRDLDPDMAEIERLVADVCNRQVVLLGEDAHHNSGRTFEVKVLIARRLIERCGFGAVAFESQFYDFIEFQDALDRGTADRDGLRSAIGGLWARAEESGPLVEMLYDAAVAGRVRLGGIDPQVGGVMGVYSRGRLAKDLAQVLDAPRRAECTDALSRHNGWLYDQVHPFDAPARRQLRGCAEEIHAVAGSSGGAAHGETRAMSASYLHHIRTAIDGDIEARDLGMFENLQWYQAGAFDGAKTIIWCGTSHAVKRPHRNTRVQRPLGMLIHKYYGDRAAMIGFSALSGAYGNPGGVGSPHALQVAAAGSLEAMAFDDVGGALVYLDAARLTAIGVVPGRAINYGKPVEDAWGMLLDGVIVLREERPTKPLAISDTD